MPLVNGSFEDAPDLTGWTVPVPALAAKSLLADSPDGAYTLRLVGDGINTPRVYQSIAVTPGQRFVLGATARVAAGGQAQVIAEGLNSGGAVVATLATLTSVAAAFTRMAGNVDIPVGVVAVRVTCAMVGVPAAGLAVRIDALTWQNVSGSAVNTRWSSGYGWEPSGQVEPSLWGQIDAGVGYPDILIDSVNYCDQTAEASWRSGREWWFADPEGGTGQLVLYGWHDTLHAGQRVVISAEPIGPLWTGWIDTVALEATPDGLQTTVTLVDVLGKVGEVDLVGVRPLTFAQQPLDRRAVALGAYVGATVGATVEASDTFLPQVKAQASYTGNLMTLLGENERASNAVVGVDTNGAFVVQPRAALSGTGPVVVPLVGDACPTRVTKARASTDRIINSWQLGVIPAASVAGNDPPSSIATYGRHPYNVPDLSVEPLWSTDPLIPGVYFPGVISALIAPVDTMEAEVRVQSRTSPVVALHLFDWVSWEGQNFQVMSMEWSAGPDEWSVVLGLDPTQNIVGGRPDPTPPTPPATETVTQTWTCKADAYAALTSGGLNAGNGASDELLMGRLADGTLARAFLNFTPQWNLAKVVSVKSAKLVLYSSTYSCMTAGSRRSITVSRVMAAWSEGTYAVHCGFASSNSLKYPGPAVTSSGSRADTGPSADATKWEIDITAIAKAWAAGSTNYGVRLAGTTESSSSDRMETYSRHFATASRRPVLVITYEREV